MKPGERVELIKRLAAEFAERGSDTDLILRQFGFSWSDTWDGAPGPMGYALYHIEGGDDAKLAALAEYLLADDRTMPSSKADLRWRKGCFRLFLSHVSKQSRLVGEVKGTLEEYGIDGFVAHRDIEPTREWVGEIESALATCDALVAFMTLGFHESDWTDQEVGFAVGRRMLVLPIRLGLDPYGFISRYQALTPKSDKAGAITDEVIRVLVTHDLTSSRMGPALVNALLNSGSFQQSRNVLDHLERFKRWTPEMLRALEASLENNSQVRDAWGVPQRVKSLLAKHSS